MTTEHPSPTNATAKKLYAQAFSCAYPGCARPLYREDEATGEWVLNSQICHIAARREGGPRWDSNQSPEENRSERNLLLMCLEHASAIDNPNTVPDYRAPKLQEWKQAQIEDHRRRMEGWPLTSKMAEKAIHASFSNVGIAINQSTVHLGGDGGKAPGAGGGGGGAIGENARAGRGGDGGDHYVIDKPLAPEALEEMLQLASSDPENIPGSGGDGAGAIGENTIGGNGGNGGDIASGEILIPAGNHKIEISKGGRAARLPGQHAEDGGDTVLHIRPSDGSVERVIRVQGGKARKAGELPDGVIEITEADISGGFQISTLMLANAVEFRDGVIYMLGGGWVRWNVMQLPSDAIWNVLCVASWSNIDNTTPRGLQLCLLNPKGVEVSRIAIIVSSQYLDGTNMFYHGCIGAPLDCEGQWVLRVQSGGFLLSQIEITVGLIWKMDDAACSA